MNIGRIDLYRMPVYPFYNHSDAFHRLDQYIGIPDIRHIFYQYGFIRHNRCRKNSKRRILGASYLHFPD